MSTTDVPQFEGTATLDDDKVNAIKEWLASAMGDSDKADEVENVCYYDGTADGLRSVLELLYDDHQER